MSHEFEPIEEPGTAFPAAGESLQQPDEAMILDEDLDQPSSSGIAGKIATGVLYGALMLFGGLTALAYAAPSMAAGLSEALPGSFFGDVSVDDRAAYGSSCCKGACPLEMESTGMQIGGDS
ncbi:MAG: hypothetical protein AAF664_02315 [Planctomycetota bacterium]